MSADDLTRTSRLRAHFDQPELLGARWWQRQLDATATAAAAMSRREALQRFLVAGGAATLAGVGYLSVSRCSRGDQAPHMRRAVELQREQGWNVDAQSVALEFPHAVAADADGTPFDAATLTQLAAALVPPAPWQPWYVTTLLQSVAGKTGDALTAVRPICTPAMRAAFATGEALATICAGLGDPAEAALIADLPGPEAVALAAGAGTAFTPVLTFDNWPHPRGVVPAHLTLAAVCYYAPRLRRTETGRPPVFVLDRARLDEYRNEPNRFDNRYRVTLPDAAHLQQAGIRRVLMVVPAGATTELDDLNDTVDAWRARGIEVRLVSLAEFGPPADQPAAREGQVRHRYLGSPFGHWWFFHHYGWPMRPGSTPQQTPPAAPLISGYRPSLRQTMFTRGGVAGLGQVRDERRTSGSVRSSGSWGRSSGRGFTS